MNLASTAQVLLSFSQLLQWISFAFESFVLHTHFRIVQLLVQVFAGLES